MSWQSIAIGLAALALVCWALGAYNRLVRLRTAVREAFGPVHEALDQAAQWLQGLVQAQPEASDMWTSAGAAAQQLQAALGPVRREPLDAKAIAALNAAHGVFAQAVQRLPESEAVSMNEEENTGGRPCILVPVIEKTQKHMAVNVAAQAFNAQVLAHNAAVHTFPAALLAWFLGFAPAGQIDAVNLP